VPAAVGDDMKFRALTTAAVASMMLTTACAPIDSESEGEDTTSEASADDSEDGEPTLTIAGNEAHDGGYPSYLVCLDYVEDVLQPAIDGTPDDDLREWLEDVHYDAGMMADTPSNRLLYDMLEELVAAWDADDIDGVEAASQRLNIRCESELN
jgi:hypothetical protein